MAERSVLRELAAEITISLLSIAPGTDVIGKLLPDTVKKSVRATFGVEKADTLEKAIDQALNSATDSILGSLRARPESHEHGATFSAINDFQLALSNTKLDARMIATALIESEVLEMAIENNCPLEHQKWASELRRDTFKRVVHDFSAAILAIAPQIPAIVLAVSVETYRQVSELRALLSKSSTCSSPTP